MPRAAQAAPILIVLMQSAATVAMTIFSPFTQRLNPGLLLGLGPLSYATAGGNIGAAHSCAGLTQCSCCFCSFSIKRFYFTKQLCGPAAVSLQVSGEAAPPCKNGSNQLHCLSLT